MHIIIFFVSRRFDTVLLLSPSCRDICLVPQVPHAPRTAQWVGACVRTRAWRRLFRVRWFV